MDFKRIIPVVIAAAAIAVPAGASAAPNPGAQCGTGASSGAFGAFGEHGEAGLHDHGPEQRRGTSLTARLVPTAPRTGANNSAVCGNR